MLRFAQEDGGVSVRVNVRVNNTPPCLKFAADQPPLRVWTKWGPMQLCQGKCQGIAKLASDLWGWVIMPTGENRLASLYLQPRQSETVREYIERAWPGQFALLEPTFAVESGLFGPGEIHPRLYDRLGDLIAISLGDSYLWWSPNADHLLGRHGGLSPDEMLVPFVAAEL